MDNLGTGTVHGGVIYCCYFCGKEASGRTMEGARDNAIKEGWGRYKHHEYYEGHRWVCPACQNRHRVYKDKDEK